MIYSGKFKVTSPFGMRTLNGKPDDHRGIDVVGLTDKHVCAVVGGRVVSSTSDKVLFAVDNKGCAAFYAIDNYEPASYRIYTDICNIKRNCYAHAFFGFWLSWFLRCIIRYR